MKYFRWSPETIDAMSWDNYTMYLASIPKSDPVDKPDDDAKEVDLFNFDKRV